MLLPLVRQRGDNNLKPKPGQHLLVGAVSAVTLVRNIGWVKATLNISAKFSQDILKPVEGFISGSFAFKGAAYLCGGKIDLLRGIYTVKVLLKAAQQLGLGMHRRSRVRGIRTRAGNSGRLYHIRRIHLQLHLRVKGGHVPCLHVPCLYPWLGGSAKVCDHLRGEVGKLHHTHLHVVNSKLATQLEYLKGILIQLGRVKAHGKLTTLTGLLVQKLGKAGFLRLHFRFDLRLGFREARWRGIDYAGLGFVTGKLVA